MKEREENSTKQFPMTLSRLSKQLTAVETWRFRIGSHRKEEINLYT